MRKIHFKIKVKKSLRGSLTNEKLTGTSLLNTEKMILKKVNLSFIDLFWIQLVFIYISLSLSLSLFVYIYMCVCVCIYSTHLVYIYIEGCPRGVMVKAMDCGIVVREFVLQLRYYVHFRANTLGKGMNPLILPAMG